MFLSFNGSYVKMRNDATGHQTEVPYHGSSLKKGLGQAILKQAVHLCGATGRFDHEGLNEKRK